MLVVLLRLIVMLMMMSDDGGSDLKQKQLVLGIGMMGGGDVDSSDDELNAYEAGDFIEMDLEW
jgi:hypothetical protein